MLAAIRESWWPLERWNFLQNEINQSSKWCSKWSLFVLIFIINPLCVCCCWLLMINHNCNLLPEHFEGVPGDKGSKKRISQRLINLRFAILYTHNYTCCWGGVICQMFYTSKTPNPLNFYPIPGWFATPEDRRQRRQDTWSLGGGWESSTWTWHSSASWVIETTCLQLRDNWENTWRAPEVRFCFPLCKGSPAVFGHQPPITRPTF